MAELYKARMEEWATRAAAYEDVGAWDEARQALNTATMWSILYDALVSNGG